MMDSRGRSAGDAVQPVKIGRCRSFSYPKFAHTPGVVATREMADLGIVDRLMLRTVVARIGAQLEASLSPKMYANRLAEFGPAWKVRDYTEGYVAFRTSQMESLLQNWWEYTLFADIATFYPSLSVDVLERELRHRCRGAGAPDAIQALVDMLRQWRDRGELHGLPIGEEACGVIASAVLASIHDVLQQVAPDHHGYSDDLVVFASNRKTGRIARAALEEHLGALGLRPHPVKTHEVLDPVDAACKIENFALSYIDDFAGLLDDRFKDKVHELWYERVAGPIDEPHHVSEVKYVLNRMRGAGDAHAVDGLLRRWDLMQLLPKETIKYLRAVAPDNPLVLDAMLRAASHPPTPTNEALMLHAFKYLSERPRDDRLLTVGDMVLESEKAHAPTKAWAAYAMRRAPSWSCVGTLERAEAGQPYLVERAMIASTRGSREIPITRLRLLASIAKQRVDMAATCEWAMAA